ncbi:hypothetical protein LMH87_001696 [Akanthomyces muscarius]|uniref:NAD dependent epimerase/dehydratase n=1 Tax=Akanthomyces muscarius TaxID=2231603 RepID=A0A9W8Q850_AKAMU|nr:hypothetical protein LMH87_001696 [Akanthomyces muscarius]KAJ4147151.1 hypothetical protein LMH87_001696 [Akanthomyces muscarius]
MKVLCLGYSRTGTRSLREALLTLGFVHTYHTMDAAFINTRDCQTWLKWLRAKHDGIGRIPGRKDFDGLLGHCQAVCDMPAAYFAEELLEAYPDAKVILTTRDVDKWHKSVTNTLEVVDNSVFWATIGLFASLLRMPNRWNWPMFQKLHQVLYNHDFPRNGKASFEAHYARVRALVPADRLLEYHVSEGWTPLCAFLDRPMPEDNNTPFINQTSEINDKLMTMHMENLKAQGKRVLDICAYAALTWSVAQALRVVMERQNWITMI